MKNSTKFWIGVFIILLIKGNLMAYNLQQECCPDMYFFNIMITDGKAVNFVNTTVAITCFINYNILMYSTMFLSVNLVRIVNHIVDNKKKKLGVWLWPGSIKLIK